MAPTATLRNWTIVRTSHAMFLKGHAYNHVNRNYAHNGDLIVTSKILHGEDGYIHTSCGVYKVEN